MKIISLIKILPPTYQLHITIPLQTNDFFFNAEKIKSYLHYSTTLRVKAQALIYHNVSPVVQLKILGPKFRFFKIMINIGTLLIFFVYYRWAQSRLSLHKYGTAKDRRYIHLFKIIWYVVLWYFILELKYIPF